ncbi:hypothetical protein NE237_032849 [Protea cynaroides]|uniref:Autophagy-related protein n=1 Tax=Protea cynaroides TaxID=273540 RepID=A0A9Q0L3V7_9MAGN|nr:hypothetical protein NE237_032849 [Protea cynaroides]
MKQIPLEMLYVAYRPLKLRQTHYPEEPKLIPSSPGPYFEKIGLEIGTPKEGREGERERERGTKGGINYTVSCFADSTCGGRSLTMAKSSFKLEHPLERRQAEAARIREKYPDRIPVIVEKAEKSDIPDIDKKKYLVPADLTVGQFVYVVRKRIKLSAEKAIFIFVKNILPPTAAMMSAIYEENKDEDGFLYMTYSGENTFG